ncbi:DUF2953 domain-containing protein [Metabacillus arenae]|uniref:DUF2953 domain-containing protein n=1 Tax=Metabacillus arenae TaxID=2771434 RepID=A0A926NF56_9BACI|nr:DUF2953 domain-containing protein [Metabacillus arenae]MBD1380126.1 DUF2953 domain-containing protein [Metabacillus arenae]
MIPIYWIIGIVIILLLMFLILFITKITITIDLNHSGDDDHYKIKFQAWYGILRYTINIPFVKIDDQQPNLMVKEETGLGAKGEKSPKKKDNKITPDDIIASIKDVREITEHIIGLNKITRKFLKHVKVIKFEWHSLLGVGDAALTGMVVGTAWTLKGMVVGLVSSYMNLKTMPVMMIEPDFYHLRSKTTLQCIISFRFGNAMLAGLRFVKYWKGGRPWFKNSPFSFLNEKKNKTA